MAMGDGAVFAGYTIQGLLASSAAGDRYVARHPRLPRLDELRVLPASLTGDASFRQRFEHDADRAAALRHPNIVGVHDRGEFDGRLWIASDFVQGTDSGRLLRDRYPYGMAAREVLEIVTAVADALDHAHHHTVLHGNLTPGNILLTSSVSEPQRILLAGLGIPRTAEGTADAVGYAAPEQLMGGVLDGRADQYALAATAFHLLTGVAPYPAAAAAPAAAIRLNAPPPLLAQRRPDLAPLDPALSKAMNIDPAQRFSRCADFAQAIAASINTPAAQWAPPATQWPAGAWPSTPFYPTAAPKRNVLTAVLVPLLLTVLLLGAGAFAGTQFFRPRPQPSTAAPQWQPYVDYAKQFAGWLTSLSPQSAGSDIQRILDGSTGEFHDEFAKTRDQFLKTIVDANVSTQGNVKSGALDSISGTTAQVLVAASADVTNTSGAKQDPRSWRLELRVEKLGDTYKVSKVEFVT